MKNILTTYRWNFIFLISIFTISCTTTTSTVTTGTSTIYKVALVQVVAEIQTLNKGEVDTFKTQNKVIGQAVLDKKLYDVYWADELQVDYAIIKEKGEKYELLKVNQIGTVKVEKFEGTRNGEPFKETRFW